MSELVTELSDFQKTHVTTYVISSINQPNIRGEKLLRVNTS